MCKHVFKIRAKPPCFEPGPPPGLRYDAMKVIIPVAGKGTRLYPHTHTLPKPLLPVAGKAIIEHILERLRQVEPTQVVLVVNPDSERAILDHVASRFPWEITAVAQEQPLGLGHAVHLAEPGPGPTLIVLGDTIIDAHLDKWIEQGDFIGVKEVDDPRRFGVVQLDHRGNVVSAVEKPEKPPTNLAIVGLYYLSRGEQLAEALDRVIASGKKTKNEFQLTDALGLMLAEGWRPAARIISGWHDCGKIDALLRSNSELLLKTRPEAPNIPGVRIIPPVFVDDSAQLESCEIGPGVSIMAGAVVRNCVLKNCIVSHNARLQNCRLHDSVIGRNAKVIGLEGSVSIGDHSVVEVI